MHLVQNSLNALKWLKRTKWFRLLTFFKEPTKMGKGTVLTWTSGPSAADPDLVTAADPDLVTAADLAARRRLLRTDKGTNCPDIRANIFYPK